MSTERRSKEKEEDIKFHIRIAKHYYVMFFLFLNLFVYMIPNIEELSFLFSVCVLDSY
jgi:hypothetical protein